ncbi:MAG: hypothetical protein H6553_08490 [Chitinophagales bacterium]|nr:hypothetical protein [Chitinophagales bacterium]
MGCNSWNPGTINGPTLTGNATTLNVEMQSWEEDGCGSNCTPNTCGIENLWNDDDIRCGRLRIGNIKFMAYPPCTDHTYTGVYTSVVLYATGTGFLFMYPIIDKLGAK